VRTAALVFFCLVVIPACVLAFAASQPRPRPYVPSAAKRQAAVLRADGWIDVRCTAQGDGALMCSGGKPGHSSSTYYLLFTTDS
jgi:hypothetical protein